MVLSDGVSELLQFVCTQLLGIYCGFASILNLNFGFPNFVGKGVPIWWWTLVVSDRALMSCYKPSIQSRKASVAFLLQF